MDVGAQFIAPCGEDRPPGRRNELRPYIFASLFRYVQMPSSLILSYGSGPDESNCNGSDDGGCRDPVTVLIPNLGTEVLCGSGVTVCRCGGICGSNSSDVLCSKGCVTGRCITVEWGETLAFG